MRFISSIVLCLSFLWGGAMDIERKVIIENGEYFFCTVHQESFIGTLHRGDVDKSIGEGKNFALPLGRALRDEYNPLAWDIQKGFVFGLNFMDHPQNDLMEALKRFPIDELGIWGDKLEEQMMEMIFKAALQNSLSPLVPMDFLWAASGVMEDFFYDLRVVGSDKIVYALANQGLVWIWQFDGEDWRNLYKGQLEIRESISLIEKDDRLYVFVSQVEAGKNIWILEDGELRSAREECRVSPFDLRNVVFIEDRDRGYYYLADKRLVTAEENFKDIIGQLQPLPINN